MAAGAVVCDRLLRLRRPICPPGLSANPCSQSLPRPRPQEAAGFRRPRERAVPAGRARLPPQLTARRRFANRPPAAHSGACSTRTSHTVPPKAIPAPTPPARNFHSCRAQFVSLVQRVADWLVLVTPRQGNAARRQRLGTGGGTTVLLKTVLLAVAAQRRAREAAVGRRPWRRRQPAAEGASESGMRSADAASASRLCQDRAGGQSWRNHGGRLGFRRLLGFRLLRGRRRLRGSRLRVGGQTEGSCGATSTMSRNSNPPAARRGPCCCTWGRPGCRRSRPRRGRRVEPGMSCIEW